nr:coiled-coil domain-containing protein 130-like [Tanacetum cinerariifolium]
MEILPESTSNSSAVDIGQLSDKQDRLISLQRPNGWAKVKKRVIATTLDKAPARNNTVYQELSNTAAEHTSCDDEEERNEVDQRAEELVQLVDELERVDALTLNVEPCKASLLICRFKQREQKKQVAEEVTQRKIGLGVRLLLTSKEDLAAAKRVKFSSKFNENRTINELTQDEKKKNKCCISI